MKGEGIKPLLEFNKGIPNSQSNHSGKKELPPSSKCITRRHFSEWGGGHNAPGKETEVKRRKKKKSKFHHNKKSCSTDKVLVTKGGQGMGKRMLRGNWG